MNWLHYFGEMDPERAGKDEDLLEARRLKMLIREESIKSFEVACRRDTETVGRRDTRTPSAGDRKTLWTVSTQQSDAIGLLLEGKTVGEVAKAKRISKCELHQWLKDDDHFIAEYRRQLEARGDGSFDVEYERRCRERVGLWDRAGHFVSVYGVQLGVGVIFLPLYVYAIVVIIGCAGLLFLATAPVVWAIAKILDPRGTPPRFRDPP